MTAASWLALSCVELNLGELTKPGVYVLFCEGDVVYVGESKNVLSRVGQHSIRFRFDRAIYWPERKKRERLAVEGALIRRFNPIYSCKCSFKEQHRDAEILARFGLTPDPDNASKVKARVSACWSPETRINTARTNVRWRALKKARRAGKSDRAAKRAATRAVQEFDRKLGGAS